MTSLPLKPATNPGEAYKIFLPDAALQGKEAINSYYVDLSPDRQKQAVKEISSKLELQDEGSFSTIAFTGHIGCGKSTELFRIKEDWKEKGFRVVFVQSILEVDVLDIDHTSLYLLIFQKVANELETLKISINDNEVKEIKDWFFREEILEKDEIIESSLGLEGEASIGINLPFARLLSRITSKIKGSATERRRVRETLQRNTSQLREALNSFLNRAYKSIRDDYPKGFLLILDDLDKVPPKLAEGLFFDYGAQLEGLNCTLIYTIPISLTYSLKKVAGSIFGDPTILPMVNIYEFDKDLDDLKFNQPRLNAIADVIRKRVNLQELFANEDSVLRIAEASGGCVRQLIRIMRKSALIAFTNEHQKIKEEDIEYSVKQEQFDFERRLSTNDYAVLAQVCKNKEIEKDERAQTLLYNTSVLEYNGENRWNYPNSVVRRSSSFQKELNHLNTLNII